MVRAPENRHVHNNAATPGPHISPQWISNFEMVVIGVSGTWEDIPTPEERPRP